MKTTPAVLLFASASAVLSALPAQALVTSTKAITCSSTVKLQAAIDAVPAGTVATFNVTGNCVENITIPHGKSIAIVGATATSKITAANVSLPAVTVYGDATVQRMILTNTATVIAADSVIQAERGGSLRIISSDLNAAKTETIVGAYGGEVKVSNSRIVGGWGSGLDDWGGDSLMIVEANPALPAGPAGTYETYIKSAGTGVACGLGATLRVQAKTSGGRNGTVTIEQSQQGVGGNLCTLQILNRTATRSLLRIRNNQAGVTLQGGSGVIENVLIANNTAYQAIYLSQAELALLRSTVTGNKLGLNAQQSQVRIEASTFSSNLTGDVRASNGSNLWVTSFNGVSTFSKALTWTDSFDCFSGGRIDIDNGAVTPDIGTHYDLLTCLVKG